jgi:fucose permease
MGWISQAAHRISLAYTVPLGCYCVVGLFSVFWRKLKQVNPQG